MKLDTIEPLNSNESSLPVGDVSLPSVKLASPPTVVYVFPSVSEGINPALPEQMIMASLGTVAIQYSDKSPQDPSPSLFFACRSVTRLMSQQVPKGEMQSAPTRCATLQNNYLSFLVYISRHLKNRHGDGY